MSGPSKFPARNEYRTCRTSQRGHHHIQECHMAIQPRRMSEGVLLALLNIGVATLAIIGLSGGPASDASQTATGDASKKSPALIAEGQRIFRFDTFGDEQLWTDQLRLHEVVEKSVDPTTALSV